jgi:glycosyltransferase involved in cell wall biosynthesis
MRVLVFWERAGLTTELVNPYAPLLAQALRPHGVDCVAGFPENLKPEWVAANATRIDAFHLHWPSVLYDGGALEAIVKRCAEMMDALTLARARGCRIVWTMHNLYPHDSAVHELDHLMRLAVVSTASTVIVHCERARDLLREVFHRQDGVFTIPHGHFVDPYPNRLSIAEARQQFGFEPYHFVYLFFGNVRANKGVEQLLESFCRLPGTNLRLLFAARICSDYGARVVESARDLDTRIVLYETERFANDEFQRFYNAADIAVFPFTDILTSGSAITALGFHCPVIVPALGCLPELVDESVGFLYQPRLPDALRHALERAAAGPPRDRFRAAIERKLRELDWDDIARKTAEAYRH